MSYDYLFKVVEILSGTAFHSISKPMCKKNTLENSSQLGNFYHTINLNAKTAIMKKVVPTEWITEIVSWED